MAEETKSKKPRLELDNDCIGSSPSDNSMENCVSANFPNEVWLKIFEYLPTYDILRTIAFVSKRFNDLSKDPNLIREIYLNIDILDYDKAKEAYEIIQKSKNLLEMTIFHHSDNWDFPPGLFISIMIKSCPKLRSLKFDLKRKELTKHCGRHILFYLGIDKNRPFDDIDEVEKEACEKGFQMLDFGTLKFETNFVDEHYGLCIPIFVIPEGFTGHTWNNCIWIKPNEIYLLAIIIHMKNLDCLDISSLGDISNPIFGSLFSIKTLKKLKLNKTLALSHDLIGRLQNLNELEIGHQITRQDVNNMFAPTLSMLPNLRKLIINYSGIRFFRNMFENVKFENLEWLELKDDLWNNAVNGHVLRTISENCPNLTHLVITQCTITNKELDSIKNLSKLCCIRVKNCRYVTKEYFEEKFGNIGIFEEETKRKKYQNYQCKIL